MGLNPAHAMLKKRVVIDGWRRDLFIRPAVKNIHRCLFDRAAQARLGAKVVAHSGGNSGEWLSLVHVCVWDRHSCLSIQCLSFNLDRQECLSYQRQKKNRRLTLGSW